MSMSKTQVKTASVSNMQPVVGFIFLAGVILLEANFFKNKYIYQPFISLKQYIFKSIVYAYL